MEVGVAENRICRGFTAWRSLISDALSIMLYSDARASWKSKLSFDTTAGCSGPAMRWY